MPRLRVAQRGEEHSADYLLCLLDDGKRFFKDDKNGKCVRCSRKVIFRAHSPKLEKVCVECATNIGELIVTKESMKEVEEVLWKKQLT